MKISLITATELDARLLVDWRGLQQSNPALLSPYYCPEFTLAVAAVRSDVRIAVLEASGKVTGFFPHQSHRGKGSPVGGALSDHHGMVCAPGTRWDWTDLLRGCALSFWEFDHLPRDQAPLESSTRDAVSPGLDLSEGFAAYKSRRRAAGGRQLDELERKLRKLTREVGPVRFEPHVTDRAVMDTVLRLKSQQCRRTGVPDFFSQAWTRGLVERIGSTQSPHFSGRLSALYAGGTLVSAHLGMRSPWVWHWWFPVYDETHAAYSPGGQLLVHVARTAAEQGHRLLDLGKGHDRYKQSFADCSLALAEGWARRRSLTTAWHGARQASMQWLKALPLLQPLRPLLQRARRLRSGA